ncbi:hypothetical protein UMZ34_18900 [Halopseudomonas pachastrellae]|nr:hypothetical protein UMZ34_18900 [Halopseudomonas pachastrellae]
MTAWLMTLNSIYAVFQSYTFNGNIEEYWRYTFLLEEKLKANPEYETRFIYYQLLRDDELRSSGLFVSALQYSYSAAFASFYFIVKIFGAVKTKQTGLLTLYIAGAAICIAGVLASQVRASLITLIISLATYFACYHPRGKEKFKHRRALLLLSASVLTYALALLLFGTKFDSSVQGRIVQYTYGLQNFKITGFWPGSFKGQFDSYYLYASMTFGAALFFWIYFILTSYSSIYKKINSANLSPKENFNTVIAFCTIPAAMVLACFQHLAGSLYYQIVWLLLFALLKTTKAQACPDSQPYSATTR